MDSLEFDIARIRNVQLVSEEFIQHLFSVFVALRRFRDSKEAYIFSSAINLLVQKLVFQLLDSACIFVVFLFETFYLGVRKHYSLFNLFNIVLDHFGFVVHKV